MRLGWGDDLSAVLTRTDDLPSSIRKGKPFVPAVEWEGEWREMRAGMGGGKLSFLDRFKAWTYGDDKDREKYKTLLVREGRFASLSLSLSLFVGWGDDLSAVLTRTDDLPSSIRKGKPFVPAVEWEGEWREMRAGMGGGKLSFLDRFKAWTYGDDKDREKYKTLLVREGRFASPFSDLLDEGCKTVYFRLVIPKHAPAASPEARGGDIAGVRWAGPIAVHFPATGDEGFSLRSGFYAEPLAARDGVASVILTMSYYGRRRPAAWGGYKGPAKFETLSQVMKMSASVVQEGSCLIEWLKAPPARGGLGLANDVVLTGASLGGAMSALCAQVTPNRVAVAPCLPSHGAGPVWTKGSILSYTVDWKRLASGPPPDLPAGLLASLPPGVTAEPRTPGEAEDLVEHILEKVANMLKEPPPVVSGASVIVYMKNDLFVPPWSTKKLAHHFGAELRALDGGHGSGFLLAHLQFRRAMLDALAMLGGASN
eukprot:CAMPEP_0172007550 /NCGR_PEP_ID=MMETSP1041-20130122/6174_1 /TAXON_ID=464988 /ORGANISM="Hemiselmis andersenii, Strain CCMP439" /LENGTH=481 /DNA_ID=CAMNT_0012661687 /DNA_START=730 /DNA_END=2176 /DNA_ORIENTATION=+